MLAISVVLTGVLHNYKYSIFPLVGWAISYGPRGASVATVLVSAVAVWHTAQGVGPFLGSGSGVLSGQGTRWEAADGENALALLSRDQHSFDLVVTDLVMPRMGGLALYEKVQERGNGTRVLLTSGYTAEDVRALKPADPGLRFLNKPWTVTDLLRRVRGILDEPVTTD